MTINKHNYSKYSRSKCTTGSLINNFTVCLHFGCFVQPAWLLNLSMCKYKVLYLTFMAFHWHTVSYPLLNNITVGEGRDEWVGVMWCSDRHQHWPVWGCQQRALQNIRSSGSWKVEPDFCVYLHTTIPLSFWIWQYSKFNMGHVYSVFCFISIITISLFTSLPTEILWSPFPLVLVEGMQCK